MDLVQVLEHHIRDLQRTQRQLPTHERRTWASLEDAMRSLDDQAKFIASQQREAAAQQREGRP